MMVQHPLHLRNRIALMPDAVEKITYNDQTNDLIQESLRMQTKFGISIPWENCQNYPKWIKFTSSIRKRKNRNEYPFQRRRPFNQHGSSHLGGYPSCGVEATMAFLMLRRQLP
ncbi:hypothetical protein IV203_028098 [Nitzschia inconspicua]|uniref:Uncharacterized protein n=1 Tax=Nitzschia inconspicua TaxID=303405 RepID=A0A9K3LXX0_9STRA|nr:hypothetical protein IV203_028098 [Nitzschia inconspicua]